MVSGNKELGNSVDQELGNSVNQEQGGHNLFQLGVLGAGGCY